MPAWHAFQHSFNAGELSPLLAARLDIDKYQTGCQTLENFICLPYGGLVRRPGTQYLGAAKYPNVPCRLIGFNFSVTTNFILEFGHGYIRFWTNGVQIMNPAAPTVPLEVATNYLNNELRDIQYCQINDLMYLTRPNHPPAKLTRLADNNWTFANIVWDWPPVIDENLTAVRLTPSAVSGTITVTANFAYFLPADVGSWWQIGHDRSGTNQSYVQLVLGTTSASSPFLRTLGSWSLTTYGNWKGELRVTRRLVETNLDETIRTYGNSTEGERNVSTTGTETKDCWLQLHWITAGSAGTSNPLGRIELGAPRHYGTFEIIAYVSPTQVTAVVRRDLLSTTATQFWSEGAFSNKYGFPRTVCLHEQRLIFGGTRKKPLTIHGSQIDDFENFRAGALDDQAFSFTISSNESNPINWIVSSTKMLVGTSGDEWSIGAVDDQQAMGPGNVDAQHQSSYGSAFLQAEVVNDAILFSQRQSHKIRQSLYSFEKDGWIADDLTLLANHISDQGFVETAFAQQPDSILWCITGKGKLVGMTYERTQKVIGWHRHSTEGQFESVGTIYGGNEADEIWVSVLRTVGGAQVRYIERFAPDFRVYIEEENKDAWWYLDCAKRLISGTETSHITGLSHLEGKTVGVMADGANQPTRVVSGGAIDIQESALNKLIGLPYTSLVRPMNLNIPVQDGTVQGRKMRIHKMVARFHKSLTCQYSGDDGQTWDEIFFRDRDDVMDDSPSVFTGDREFATGTNFRTFQQISLRQNRPFPLVILAMIEWCNFYGE